LKDLILCVYKTFILKLFIGGYDKKISMIDTIHYAGMVIGSSFIPRLTDLYGRKKPFLVCILAQFPLYCLALVTTSINVYITIFFFMGICYVGRYNGAYINISEYVHDKWKNPVSTWLLVWDSMASIIIAFYCKSISKYWLWLQIFGASLNFLAVIGTFFTPESPEYLYGFYKFR
jgi:MFS family permease